VLIAETLVYKANPPAAQQRLSAAAGRVSSFGGYGVDYKPLVIIEGTAEFTGVTFKLRGTGATLRTAEKGQTVEVHGTIKAHEEYAGIKQTEITRGKITTVAQ